MISTKSINQIRCIGQLAFDKLKPISSQSLVWKANEDDPRKHNDSHEGLLYNLPTDAKVNTSTFGYTTPFDKERTKYYNALGHKVLMVRKPALTAMDYIRKVNSLTEPVPNVRMLFYGDQGTGKTHILTHLLHYLHLSQDHIILHVRSVKKFVRNPYSFEPSTSRPGRIDTNLNAAHLLQQFLFQNAQLLKKFNDTLVCSKDYRWSLREETKAGESISEIATHGVNRITHASDCVAVLCKELAIASNEGKIKLATVLDNVKFLYTYQSGTIKHPDGKFVFVDEMTVARALRKLIKGTHKNSILLGTCDDKMSKKHNQTPKEVLGQEGWDHFDPFLPINVPVYSRKEFDSYMDFLQDIGWLCRPESRTVEARNEVRFVSGMNPAQVAYLCQAM